MKRKGRAPDPPPGSNPTRNASTSYEDPRRPTLRPARVAARRARAPPRRRLFPLLPVDSPEFGELVSDIGEHGLLQPIVLHEGKILDGRNRHRACQHAGVEPRFEEWSGESPTAYVLLFNLHRRHLTERAAPR
jgi:hypothetical protein